MVKIIKSERASLTLEASIVLPIFIFLLLFFYGILMMFSGQQLILHALLQSGESLSLDSYATEAYGSAGSDTAKDVVNTLYRQISTSDVESRQFFSSSEKWYEGDIKDEAKNRFLGYFSGGDEARADSLLGIVGVSSGLSGLDFSKSYKEDNGDLHIIVTYKQSFLFDFSGAAEFDREMEVVTHMW